MSRTISPSRAVAAVALLALAAGTALAASPSPSPDGASPISPRGASSSAAPTTSTTLASTAPRQSEASEAPKASKDPKAAKTPESPRSAAEVADVVGRLKAAGITTTAAAFESLAAKVGTGGAVRTLAFAQASGKTPAQIIAMFEDGKGWGQIRHELGLKIGPGIGWIMGHGHGKAGAS